MRPEGRSTWSSRQGAGAAAEPVDALRARPGGHRPRAGIAVICSRAWRFVPSSPCGWRTRPGRWRGCASPCATRVNILALSLDAAGVLHLVPDNPVHAAGLLRGRDYAVDEREVLYVTVPNGPGALASATRMLSTAAVNIDYAFASALADHDMTAVVVGVDDAQRASTAAGM